jgi:hypothetical protein
MTGMAICAALRKTDSSAGSPSARADRPFVSRITAGPQPQGARILLRWSLDFGCFLASTSGFAKSPHARLFGTPFSKAGVRSAARMMRSTAKINKRNGEIATHARIQGQQRQARAIVFFRVPSSLFFLSCGSFRFRRSCSLPSLIFCKRAPWPLLLPYSVYRAALNGTQLSRARVQQYPLEAHSLAYNNGARGASRTLNPTTGADHRHCNPSLGRKKRTSHICAGNADHGVDHSSISGKGDLSNLGLIQGHSFWHRGAILEVSAVR